MRAVRFDEYGDVDVLQVVDVPRPTPGPNEVLVRVKATGINPGEAKIRRGLLHARWPATFPSGEGSDLAGVIEEVGSGVHDWSAGDEVIGYSGNRAAHAELVVVEAAHLTAKPPALSWGIAGSLFVAGATAYAAVEAVNLGDGDVVAVSGAAGGVGSIVVQLARLAGATVIGIASPSQHDWLRDHGVTPIAYGDGLADRLRAAGHLNAFIDTVGGGYADMAVSLGIAPARVDTIADFEAADRLGVKIDGNAAGASAKTLAHLAGLIVDGKLEIPLAATYPLSEVRAAFHQLEAGHVRGKIVLTP